VATLLVQAVERGGKGGAPAEPEAPAADPPPDASP